MNFLSELLLDQDIKVACITESHLVPTISSSFIGIPHFSLVRNDVTGPVQKHGVCVYIHESVLIDSVDLSLANVLSFRLTAFNVYVVVVYRPPSNTSLMNDQVASYISNFCLDKEVVVLGDFNLPNINWAPESSQTHISSMETTFLDTFDTLGLTQWVLEPTFPRSGNTLDIILTSDKDRIGNTLVIPPLPGCDHCPVLFEYLFESDDSTPVVDSDNTGDQRRDWHRGRYPLICQHLSDIDWSVEFAYLRTQDCVDRFTDIVSDLTEQLVPLKKNRESKPPWQTRPPTGLIRQRQQAWQRFKSARQQLGRHSAEAHASLAQFNSVNKQYRSFSIRAQADYESNLIVKSVENPKVLHSYIRNRKVGRPSVGPLRLCSGEISDSPALMSECFAESFSAVYNRNSPANPAPHQRHEGELQDCIITTDEVKAALADLDGNSAMGPDNMHPFLLKACSAELAQPLSIIFNRSLREGVVPEAWKKSTVVPIFKKGSRYDPLNYRPVSLTSVCCKTLERIIAQQLTSFLEDASLLNPNQFGFRSGRSTMDQLLLVYCEVSKRVDEGGIVDVILFDYSKAFDVVCHDILIEKLACLGIQGNLLQWISSFLLGRQMRVSVKGSLSHPRKVMSGVPQGSVLGPLLFLVYINHIASNLTCMYKIFADDLKIYACVRHRSSPGVSSSTADVQSDINLLHSTSSSWGLTMNPKKCAVLRFSRHYSDLTPAEYFMNGLAIPSVKSHLDLGVWIDIDLKFHEHIRTTVRKAGGLAQNFLKSTVCRKPDFMLFLLTTHIRPIIEYCSCIWNTGYLGDLRLLESVQRKWTKQIETVKDLGYGDRLRALDLYSVQGRLMRADLIQCWKIFNGKSHISPTDLFQLAPQRGTRGHCYKIFLPTSCTDIRKRSFNVRSIPVWNALTQHTVTAPSLASFKKRLAESLGDRLFEYVQ